MLKKFATEIQIISIILVVLLIVSVSGVFAYRGLHDIIKDVGQSARPETKLVLLKQILSDLSAAESGVKSYNLTHDPNYLSPFYRSGFTIDKNMDDLGQLVADDNTEKKLLDSMNFLIDKKFTVLNELLALHTDENITKELTRVSDKMEEETKKIQSSLINTENPEQLTEPKQEPEKTNIFKRLFGKKKKSSIPSDSILLAEKKLSEIKKLDHVKNIVKGEIKKVNTEHVEQLREIKKAEFELTAKNEELMNYLRQVVNAVELTEKKSIENNILLASEKAKKTNNIVAMFCIVAGILLLLVSFVIINYLKKNRAYAVALKKSKIQAEEIAKAKENFLANMSHEIRTPMNAIAGFTQQVLQTDLTKTQHEQLTIVKKSTDHLLHIINDILDHSKIQSGNFSFASIAFKPAQVLAEVIKLSAPLLNNKELKLNYSVDAKTEEVLNGDPSRLRQIMINLVSNSIKFTEKGSIDVSLKTEETEPGKVVLFLNVSDTGIGIPQNKIREVFEEYHQADDHIFFKYGGTGLGLAITKKLVELQNGTMSIESREGVFTSVKIKIPYATGILLPEKTEKKRSVLNHTLLNNVTALVADDDDYNRKLLSTILHKWNMKVVEAHNGKEVVEKVMQNNFDIILMDARMPELSGIEATKQIRNLTDKKKAEIPVIALTAVSSIEKINKCMEAGMNDFISKPFSEEDLFKRILLLVSKDQKELFTEVINSEPGTAADKEKEHFHLEELQQLSNGDEKFLNEMIRIFIQTTQEGVSGIEQGLQNKDLKVIGDFAHKISSPCRHLGAGHLLSLLKSIENRLETKTNGSELEKLVKETRKEADLIIEGLENKLKELQN